MGDDCGRKERWLIFFLDGVIVPLTCARAIGVGSEIKMNLAIFVFRGSLRHQLTAVGHCTIVKY